ncbi:Uncharacterized protein APZ42_008419 [Daphnia magna]|uniref:Uncharacterized protein n=1 Tax=Daphnia magna TaxID=35525 RepID=A0A164EN40_9CRUS|nr:Uncharacterized protein APZ42_008419 [Daphnia magna]
MFLTARWQYKLSIYLLKNGQLSKKSCLYKKGQTAFRIKICKKRLFFEFDKIV